MTTEASTTTKIETTQHVVVLNIPILGERGVPHSRLLVLDRAPTKEGTISVLRAIYERAVKQERPSNGQGWLACIDTVLTIPEEIFARLNQRRAASVSFLCAIEIPGGGVEMRPFTARVSSVTKVPHQ